jgi:hypothetical protein
VDRFQEGVDVVAPVRLLRHARRVPTGMLDVKKLDC